MRNIFLVFLVVSAFLSTLVDLSLGWSRGRRRRRYVTPASRRRRRSCSPQNCSYYWYSHGSCSRSCGGGSQSQRLIITRYSSCGGSSCPYSRYRTTSCNTHCCRVDCAWSWNSWSSCQGCGMSNQTRTMRITRNPSCGGTMCPFIRSQTQNCNTGV